MRQELLYYKDFLIKFLPLGNPIIYYDGDVDDEDNGDNESENYDKRREWFNYKINPTNPI